MVIWSGLGYIVLIVLAAVMLGGQMLVGDTWAANKSAQAIAFAVAGVIVFIVDKVFISKRKDTNFIHQDTGEVKTLRANDTCFFIPFRFWPFILVAGGVAYHFFA